MWVFLAAVLWQQLPLMGAHHSWHYKQGSDVMKQFVTRYGAMVSFQNPIYSNGFFFGFDGWKEMNSRYGADNVTYIVRVEFARDRFKESRVRKHFSRFWLPGVLWVERCIRQFNLYNKSLAVSRARAQSHVDLWVQPECFLRHHGVSRIARVAKSMKLQVHQIKWMAKVTYSLQENYGPPEVMEIGKALITLPGIQCSWVHPQIESSFGMMVSFVPDQLPAKGFFSLKNGYNSWDVLNNEYMVQSVQCLRGWSRALIYFAGGLHCREGSRKMAERYLSLPSVQFIYLDSQSECKLTYQIVLSFDRLKFSQRTLRNYKHWDSLNHLYGVINISHHLSKELRAILEFEPGLYTHQQMKAIRDEYLKLPGIRFGWVMGKRAVQVSTIVLNFDKEFLRRVPMRKYNYWEGLNKQFHANITIQDEINSRAFIRFAEGAHSDLKLKAILRKYRQLPGIASVRMDREHVSDDESGHGFVSQAMNASWMLPSKRSLKSWLHLSQVDPKNLPSDVLNDNKNISSRIIRPQSMHTSDTQCINESV